MSAPAVSLRGTRLAYGPRTLWNDLSLEVVPGELLAVLGPNGAGKSTLLRVLLGLTSLTAGTVTVAGHPPRRGNPRVGYVPQQKGFDPALPLRGVDLVRLGVGGHRWGWQHRPRDARARVSTAVDAVGATAYAHRPIGLLSGGEQQRLRIAQALVADPALLLCDEPLLSLDLAQQAGVVDLIDTRCRQAGTAVVFVTHEINPVLSIVDRVLYLAAGRWAIGTPAEVMTSAVLTDLYGTPVDVLHVRDRIVVIGTPEGHHHTDHARTT